MKNVLAALSSALVSLFEPRVLRLILWPMLGALALWTGLAMMFWHTWSASLAGWLGTLPIQHWIEGNSLLRILSDYLTAAVLIMLLLPAVYVTALLITSLLAMPVLVDDVGNRHYADLKRMKGGTTWGSIGNSLAAIVIYGIMWLITLPLWLFTPLAAVLPVLLSAYLNQRLFRYDAWSTHATKTEYELLLNRYGTELYVLGGILGLLQFVPLLNFFVPVYAALAFIHFALARLRELRVDGVIIDT